MYEILTLTNLFLTGLITSAIQDAETPVISSMKHKNVGVLRYRTLDISFLATSGGKAVQSDASNYQMEILSLIWKLKKEQIDGILLDKSTYDNLRFLISVSLSLFYHA